MPSKKSVETLENTKEKLDREGVRLLYANGDVRYDHKTNNRHGGYRFIFSCGKTFLNCEITGYFADFDGIDDEVSGKMRGGKHFDGSIPKTFDLSVGTKTGKTRYRTEERHPEVSDSIYGGTGVPLGKKFVGYKFVCKNEGNEAIRLEIWQDAGDNEGDKPANDWKQISSWKVTEPLWNTVADDHEETIRIDDDRGGQNLKAKWLSLGDITTT